MKENGLVFIKKPHAASRGRWLACVFASLIRQSSYVGSPNGLVVSS